MAFALSSQWCIFAFWLALLGSLRTTCATRARIQMQCWVWGATASPNLRTQTNRTTRSGHPCQTRNSRGSHSFGSGRTRPGWRRFGTLPIVISHKSSTFSRLFFWVELQVQWGMTNARWPTSKHVWGHFWIEVHLFPTFFTHDTFSFRVDSFVCHDAGSPSQATGRRIHIATRHLALSRWFFFIRYGH